MSSDGDLRPIFRERLRTGFHWQSMELGLVGAGTPDSSFGCATTQREGWVEFKQTHAWAVTLRPEQVGWLVNRSRHGGRCFVAVRRWKTQGEGGVAADQLWLLDGRWARELREGGLRWAESQLEVLGKWEGGPSAWDWDAVRAVLGGAPLPGPGPG